MKTAILFGGRSTEHEVSCISAASVLRNIRKNHELLKIGITKAGEWFQTEADPDTIESGAWEGGKKTPVAIDFNSRSFVYGGKTFTPDVVFPILHGKNGEDGTVQGLFELMRVPYVGPKVLGSSVCMDKAYMKIVFEKAGLRQVAYETVEKYEYKENAQRVIDRLVENLPFPMFVKPSNAGSSVGITKVKKAEELTRALAVAFAVDRRVVVEQGLENPQEIEVAVLGNNDPIASCTGRIVPANDFYDYEAKYASSDSRAYIPSGSDKEDEIRALAIRAYRACDCKGMSRCDFMVDDAGKIYINEINTLPGFTSISMYPKLFAASGVPYDELIDRLLALATENLDA